MSTTQRLIWREFKLAGLAGGEGHAKYWLLFLTGLCLVLNAGCGASSLASAPTTSTPAPVLPTPASVTEAALVNLRPLTTSGLAFLGDWSPDGTALIYTEAEAAFPYGQPLDEPPQTEVRWMRADGSANGGDDRLLAENGYALLFSLDGQTVYFGREIPNSGMSELWAVDLNGSQPRRILEPIGGLTVHRLGDGRLVISEAGTYAPLRVYDPATGRVSDLTGQMPTNFPEDARLSPDGTRLAYPKGQEVYLAEPDASQARAISSDGGFSARVWWSPDSRFLAYTSGSHMKDSLLLADRDGQTLATLSARLEESGYVSGLAWSPDSRWPLVVADAYSGQPHPTRLYLFDTAGHGQLLLETCLHNVAWSPNGRTVALSRWDGPQGELATHNIWLAELTDRATLAQLPAPTPAPTLSPTPPLPLPPADLSEEQVIRRFWEAIDAHDYRTAWATLTSNARAENGLTYWQPYWQCIRHAQVVEIHPMQGNDQEKMYDVEVNLDPSPDCARWMRPGPFTIVVRETPAGPWLIKSFNTGP